MDNKLSEMPFLKNIGLVMTFKCQVTCPHCIIEAGPHRKEEVPLSYALDWIRQVAEYRNGYIKVLSLTGGEPFFNIANLKRISGFGEDCGLFVSAVTNAFWASTRKKAIEVLGELKAIKMLSISTDVHHQMYIPFECVKNAIFAAKVHNIPYTVAVCTENETDEEYKTLLDQLRKITEANTILTAITFPAGRALHEVGVSKYRLSKEPTASACSAGSSPIIFPDGRIIACIGPIIKLSSPHPLQLGNLREESLGKLLDDAERNPILHAIRIWGPRELISMVKEAGMTQFLPETYIEGSLCDACYRLMSNIKIVDFLTQLASDFNFVRKTAYARVFYLRETEMVKLFSKMFTEN